MTASEKCMLGFVLVFLTSALWPSLPKISLLVCALFLLIYLLKYRFGYFIVGMLCGFIWAGISAHFYIHWQFPSHFNQQNLVIEGYVDSIIAPSSQNKDSVYLTFVATKIGQNTSLFSPKIRLSWFQANADLQQGQRWRLFVKLKSAVGLANKEGFNYQKWLASKNIVATGYVKASPSNTLLNANTSWRQQHINELSQYNLVHQKWLKALMYGDRSELEQHDWQLMQNTGTAHLFAISGMHLGIVFAGMMWLSKSISILHSIVVNKARSLACNSSCNTTINNSSSAEQFNFKVINIVLAITVCIYYAYLAGFQVPVMRALLGACLFCILVVFDRFWRLPASLLSLLSLFLLLFPYAHLGISFWFSFIAVALIWFFTWRWPIPKNASILQTLWYGVKLQVFLSVATLPMIIAGFDTLPLVSLLANVLAIPVVTVILVPLCLFAALLQTFGLSSAWLLAIIDTSFSLLVPLLEYLNQWPALTLSDTSFSASTLFLIAWLSLHVLSPNVKHNKAFIVLCLVSVLITYSSHHKLSSSDEWHLYVFDVGQGSAMVIEVNNHFLIYDTGASFRGSFTMAESVLLPFFKSKGMPKIDKMILSHLDIDHAGGKSFLKNKLQIDTILSPADICNVGNDFVWQKLKFTILWPEQAQTGNDNDHSCVIKLHDGMHSVLFSGDIERKTEAILLKNDAFTSTNALKADVLIAPHHGSKTSSSLGFVKAVDPQYTVFSAGYQNRWGFPAPEVVARYQKQGTKIANTGKDGQITVLFSKDGISMRKYRTDEYRRWYYKAPF